MKKIIKLFILLILLLPTFFLSSCNFESSDLDRINYYEITVDPCEDGTLNLNYKIQWTVLDDKSEGPLTWVVIGVPNKFIDQITPKTNNIKKIKYVSDDGAQIRIDFTRAYYAKETLTFEFSYHLSRMYHIDNDKLKFHFTPGWFDEIKVNRAVVLWNDDNVIYANNNQLIDGYYKWEYPLDYGESFDVEVSYYKSNFKWISEDLQYSDASMTKQDKILIITILSIFVLVFVISIIVSYKQSDPYMRHRGFIHSHNHSRRYYYHHHYYSGGVKRSGARIINPSSSGRGFSGGGSCACAGGGRAGCSRKDFNHSSIDHKKVLKVLKK